MKHLFTLSCYLFFAFNSFAGPLEDRFPRPEGTSSKLLKVLNSTCAKRYSRYLSPEMLIETTSSRADVGDRRRRRRFGGTGSPRLTLSTYSKLFFTYEGGVLCSVDRKTLTKRVRTSYERHCWGKNGKRGWGCSTTELSGKVEYNVRCIDSEDNLFCKKKLIRRD